MAYQAGIANFEASGAQVFGISVDNLPTLKHWTDEHLKLSYPLLSDFQRKVSQAYGVLIPERGFANRTTFVIDLEGKIQHIEEGSAAIDPTGAVTACQRIRKKT
jgi:peroxiredoxin